MYKYNLVSSKKMTIEDRRLQMKLEDMSQKNEKKGGGDSICLLI